MLVERIKKAFLFRTGVYKEVEADKSFTGTAWILVLVVAFLNQLGANARADIGKWVLASIGGTISALIGFAVMAFILNWAGKTFFGAEVTFDEVVRTMGLAYVWNILGVIGALASFSTALTCVLTPALVIAAIMGLIASFVALKEALDLDIVPTIGAVILAFIVNAVVTWVISAILGGIFGTTMGALSALTGSGT
ncbi:MAG: hypothetical protein JXB47_14870 [Anaerolineae bacterium]|nr:hypothetical protein [Anaerolineae bacterium]